MSDKKRDEKIAKCVGILEKLEPANGDIMENAAICILDINEVLANNAKDKKEFKKQRKDCLRTMRAFYREVKKIKFTLK